ncbi:hypothetical protein Tco_0256148 [Tanacetum coccineum]
MTPSLEPSDAVTRNRDAISTEEHGRRGNSNSRMDADGIDDEAHKTLSVGTHRTLSIPNPVTTQSESSTPRKPTIIGFRVPIQPEPETPIPTAVEIDIDSLYEATRLSIATQRSLEDLEYQQNVEKVQEHMDEEYIEKIVEGGDNVDKDKITDENFK